MFKVSWTKATKAQKANLTARAGMGLSAGPLAIEPATLKVDLGQLPHYGDAARLIRFSGQIAIEPARATTLYALDSGATLSLLLGNSCPVHAINREIDFKVTPDNVLDYLRFFCFFVRGAQGPFYIIGDEVDPVIPNDVRARDVSEATDWPETTLADVIAPPALIEAKEDGSFTCAALVYYHTALYISDFTVLPNGIVHMDGDEEIIAGMPELAQIEV